MKQNRLWIGLGIISVLLVIVVIVLLVSSTARRALNVAAEGGEIQLRETLRSIRGETRVVIIAFDGVGDPLLREVIAEGKMPQVAALLGDQVHDDLFAHAYAVPETMSIIPTITMAAWSSIFTGQPQSATGIPGNEWYAREEMKLYAPAAISVDAYEHTVRVYEEGFLGQIAPVPTLFDLVPLRAHVSLVLMHRGADVLNVPGPENIPETFGRVSLGILEDEPVERDVFASLDTKAVRNAVRSIEEHGLPDLQVIYFPGVDLYTHLADPPLAQQRDYLEQVLDPAIGELLEVYRDAGVLEQTFFVFISDHGHTPVLKDARHVLGEREDNSPDELLRLSGFRPRPFELEIAEDERDYQAVITYQGPLAFAYVADRSTCPAEGDVCDWQQLPRMEEDVLALARAFDQANRTGALTPGMQDTLDLILAREPRPLDADAVPFQVFDGEQLIPIPEYLEQNPRPDLPRFAERMEWLAAGPYGHRAGDVMLVARSGASRPIEDRYYFAPKYHSLHGSPERQDSHVPLMVAHRQYSGEALQALVQPVVGEAPSVLDIVPLVQMLLEQPLP